MKDITMLPAVLQQRENHLRYDAIPQAVGEKLDRFLRERDIIMSLIREEPVRLDTVDSKQCYGCCRTFEANELALRNLELQHVYGLCCVDDSRYDEYFSPVIAASHL